MPECIFSARRERHLIDEFGLDESRHARVVDKAGEQFVFKSQADHRGRVQHAFGEWVEPVDTRSDRCLHTGRHLQLSDLVRAHVRAPVAAKHAAVSEIMDDLLGEKRVAGCPFADLVSEPGNRRVRSEQFADQREGLRMIQRCERDRLCARYLAQRTAVFGAVGDQHQ